MRLEILLLSFITLAMAVAVVMLIAQSFASEDVASPAFSPDPAATTASTEAQRFPWHKPLLLAAFGLAVATFLYCSAVSVVVGAIVLLIIGAFRIPENSFLLNQLRSFLSG